MMKEKINQEEAQKREPQFDFSVVAEVMKASDLDEIRAQAVVEIVLEAVFVGLVDVFTRLTPPDEEPVTMINWDEFLEEHPIPGEGEQGSHLRPPG